MLTRTDYLLDGRIKITQNVDGYRAGLDAVMLAAACPAQARKINDPASAGESVLDLGCGAGAAGLCLAARVENLTITGIEIQPDQAELARINFTENNFVADIIIADIKSYAFTPDSFDHIIMNPPYHDAARHDAPVHSARATAFMEDNLAAWMAAARRTVKTHGSVTIIHRADRVLEILQNMDGFGATEIIPLWPYAGQNADRVIIRARKGRKTPPQIHPGLALHTLGGGHTEDAHNILYKGVKIP